MAMLTVDHGQLAFYLNGMVMQAIGVYMGVASPQFTEAAVASRFFVRQMILIGPSGACRSSTLFLSTLDGCVSWRSMLAPSRASGNLLKEIAWETMDFWGEHQAPANEDQQPMDLQPALHSLPKHWYRLWRSRNSGVITEETMPSGELSGRLLLFVFMSNTQQLMVLDVHRYPTSTVMRISHGASEDEAKEREDPGIGAATELRTRSLDSLFRILSPPTSHSQWASTAVNHPRCHAPPLMYRITNWRPISGCGVMFSTERLMVHWNESRT
ncbi:uncharacterized protein BT62DRAFT_1009519 [Guyanagaster necrorhizus]|uniref:Uncharacterized protein n=1 Tax=Guyanagaster necrorhizus TaxID=856835 RepID=A0A9P7VLF2_9AGAR|nr:uncharacterized protein BT62DRAFT_1009519 [Guyanagaster necrorhizus MCA 3950]KAG7443308.1 hypothetical protein BT62DRAFT_1009519 [Guyanagaster necrorhizus MCA 3950]